MMAHRQRYSMQGGQLNGGRLTENKMSLDDVYKYEVTGHSCILTGNELQTLGAENRQTQDANSNL